MGTYYTNGASRKNIIKEITQGWEYSDTRYTTVAKYCSGNTLWTVQEATRITTGQVMARWIGCYLLRPSADGWGYKPMDESDHPYYYTCPMKFLAMVPEVANADWRAKVVEHHRRVNQKLVVGQLIALTNGRMYEVVQVKPLRAKDANGNTYRVPRRMLVAPVPEIKKEAEVEIL